MGTGNITNWVKPHWHRQRRVLLLVYDICIQLRFIHFKLRHEGFKKSSAISLFHQHSLTGQNIFQNFFFASSLLIIEKKGFKEIPPTPLSRFNMISLLGERGFFKYIRLPCFSMISLLKLWRVNFQSEDHNVTFQSERNKGKI